MSAIHPASRRARAFTLIELLIVVAIIAILAAIAVPNFLEAQTRAKVTRAKADMRTADNAIETYYLDNNSYPSGFDINVRPGVPESHSLFLLSTPISYITSGNLQDPFIPEPDPRPMYSTFQYDPMTPTGKMFSAYNFGPGPYLVNEGEPASWWLLMSAGPDQDYQFTYDLASPPGVQYSVREADRDPRWMADVIYDPTNGTVSSGNIWRAGGGMMNTAGRLIQASH